MRTCSSSAPSGETKAREKSPTWPTSWTPSPWRTGSPLTAREVRNCTPVCHRLEGWEESLDGVQRWEDLPAAALRYLVAIEEILGLPVEYVTLAARDDPMVVSPAHRLPGPA